MADIICKEVIVSKLSRRGKGIDHSPIRVITEVFEKDGTKIAEYDPMPETYAEIDLIEFAKWVKKMGWDADKMDHNAITKWLDSVNE